MWFFPWEGEEEDGKNWKDDKFHFRSIAFKVRTLIG